MTEFGHKPRLTGTRGGKDQFKWDDIMKDLYHRDNYLGNSVMGSTAIRSFSNAKPNAGWWTSGKGTFEEELEKRRSPEDEDKDKHEKKHHKHHKKDKDRKKDKKKKEKKEKKRDKEEKKKRKKEKESEKQKEKERRESFERTAPISLEDRVMMQELGLIPKGEDDVANRLDQTDLQRLLARGESAFFGTPGEDPTDQRMSGLGFGGERRHKTKLREVEKEIQGKDVNSGDELPGEMPEEDLRGGPSDHYRSLPSNPTTPPRFRKRSRSPEPEDRRDVKRRRDDDRGSDRRSTAGYDRDDRRDRDHRDDRRDSDRHDKRGDRESGRGRDDRDSGRSRDDRDSRRGRDDRDSVRGRDDRDGGRSRDYRDDRRESDSRPRTSHSVSPPRHRRD